MMICFKIQMMHVGVATWCWLLAFGVGSGLPDLSWLKKTMNQTTNHSVFLQPPKFSSNISGFQNNTTSYHTHMSTLLTRPEPTSSTTTTTQTPFNGPMKNYNINDSLKSGGSSVILDKSNTSEDNVVRRKGSREEVLLPVQHSQQARFIRVKHGPPTKIDRTTSKFVIKVMTDTLGRRRTQNVSTNHTSVNQTFDFPISQNSNIHLSAPLNRSRNQHHRKKIVSIGIPASSHLLGSFRTTTSSRTSTMKTTPEGVPAESDEYYSSYADYPDFTANSYNSSELREGGILPDPDLNTDDEAESEPDADALIPDDSLADTDLHDHDLIDSVMYIYFGASDRDEGGVGKQVLIVGAVIALVAQFVTLACVFRRLKTRPDDYASLIILNAEVASAVSNLTFMLGIQATGIRSHCQMVAVTLHYLHLVTCSWYFVNCINAYRHVYNPEHRTKIRLYCILAWFSPAVVVMICFLLNQKGYEIRSYCWMSLEKGMLFSFMIPVSILILLNTFFAVMGLREVSLLKSATDSDRKSLRVAATLLPMFSVVWFLGVVALENSASLVFPFLFVTTNGFMNWFIFACWLPPDLSVWKDSDDEYEDDDDDIYEEIPAMLKNQHSINDVQPLLDDGVYVCGRRDVCELQMDPICTISS